MQDFVDETLKCKDCGDEFVWTAGEQKFFADKGFSKPVRCPKCREIRKQRKAEQEARN